MNELKDILEKLKAERDAILNKVFPLRKKHDELLEQLKPIEDEMNKVFNEIESIERPRLKDVLEQIVALEKAIK